MPPSGRTLQLSQAPPMPMCTISSDVGHIVASPTEPHDGGDVMDYLRRLQMERPLLFWVAMAVMFWVAFQLVLFVVGLLIGPFGLPSWAPILVVLGALVLIARRQQR
jgi:hypothetical protein